MSGSHSKSTTNHEEIKKWAESHHGNPATVKGTEHGDEHVGLLRIDFPANGGKLVPVEWDEFFEKFEESKLELLYSDEKDSTFNKFVARGHGK